MKKRLICRVRLEIDKMKINIQDILKYLHTNNVDFYYGDSCNIEIEGYCSLKQLRSHCITWIRNITNKYIKDLKNLENCIVVSNGKVNCSNDKLGFIVTDDPRTVFFLILNHFFAEKGVQDFVGKNTIIDIGVSLGKNVTVGNNCIIAGDIEIGDRTVIADNTVIKGKVRIGKECIVHSGVVIGEDGFGYFTDSAKHPIKIAHFGGVSIGDYVEIGANVCIDRGTLDDTVIGSYVKIDNLVHIAHNVQIKENAMIVAGAIICGSACVNEGSYIAPGTIIRDYVCIGANTMIGMGSVVTKNIEGNKIALGIPAKIIGDKS